jgi:hypothetical protein
MVLLKRIFDKEKYCRYHNIFPFNRDIFITSCNIYYKDILYVFRMINCKINNWLYNPKRRCFDIEKYIIHVYYNFAPFLEKNHEFHKGISKYMCRQCKNGPWALVNHL